MNDWTSDPDVAKDCGTCQFWVRRPDLGDDEGECRQRQWFGRWQTTHRGHGCAAHVTKMRL